MYVSHYFIFSPIDIIITQPYLQIITLGPDRDLQNQGGELKEQHMLVGPHPTPSQRGSSV